jgi:hypothetical protein
MTLRQNEQDLTEVLYLMVENVKRGIEILDGVELNVFGLATVIEACTEQIEEWVIHYYVIMMSLYKGVTPEDLARIFISLLVSSDLRIDKNATVSSKIIIDGVPTKKPIEQPTIEEVVTHFRPATKAGDVHTAIKELMRLTVEYRYPYAHHYIEFIELALNIWY